MPSRSVTVQISAEDRFSDIVDRYNQKMGLADTATKNVGDNAKASEGPLNKMGLAIGGAIAAIGVQKVIDFASQLNAMGTEARQVEERFQALVAPLGDAEEVMGRLRNATLGVADDTSLQSGANMLMSMGLAESPEELEEIIGMITRLKSPTDDLNTALNNFSLMLANQSVMRLDSFGLSSGRVRQRINELLESGQALDREEAFKMATLEEGRRAIMRLGDSAEMAGTSMARMQTQIDNAVSSFAVNLSAGVEGTAGILELALGIHPAQVAKAEEDARRAAETVAIALNEGLLSETDTAGLSDDFISEFIRRSAEKALQNPDMGLQEVRAQVMRDLAIDDSDLLFSQQGIDWNAYFERGTGPLADQLDILTMISGEAMTLQATAQQRAAEEAQIAAEMERQAAAAEERRLHAEMVTEASRTYLGLLTTENDALEEAFRNVEGIADSGLQLSEMALPRFMEREQANNLAVMAEEAQKTYESMLELSEMDSSLFNEAQLENARLAAENVASMATDAEAAANAFENMSLTDLFGQTTGGMLGEIQKLVLEQAGAGGMDEAALAELGRSFALSSGQETAGSLALSEQFAPIIAGIAQEQGPDIATAMTEELGRILSEAALAGIDVNSDEFISRVAQDLGAGALMADFDASEYVSSMQDANTAALETVGSMDSIAEDMPTVAEQSALAAEGGADLAASMGDAATEATTLETIITRLASAVHTVKVVLDVDSSALTGLLAQITRDNGGVPPGSDPRMAS